MTSVRPSSIHTPCLLLKRTHIGSLFEKRSKFTKSVQRTESSTRENVASYAILISTSS